LGHFTGSSFFPASALVGIRIGVLQFEHLSRITSALESSFFDGRAGDACLSVADIART